MKPKIITPPKIFLRFFRWYCHPDLHAYIEGDLMEVYHRRIRTSGKTTADIQFVVDVVQLFRPGIIRPTGEIKNLNTGIMLKSYFTIGWRNLIRNKAYAITNVAGLALSMTCGILLFALVQHHLQYDNFHADSDRIYRVVTELHRDQINYQTNVPSPLGSFIRNEHTFAEKAGRSFTQSNVLLTLRRGKEVIKFEEGAVAFTEPEFFDIFNFPLLHGNKGTVLKEPNTAIITESTARRYFGDKDPLGETFWYKNKTPFVVTGILKDLPVNTDINAHVFVSFSTLSQIEAWLVDDAQGWRGIRDGMKCYVRLRPNVEPAEAEQLMAPYVKRFRPTSKNVHHYKLQPLSDVHFNGLYEGAMEKRNLWILTVVGLFLIMTACMNFINLATAQALKRAREVGVRKVLGSLKWQLFWQFMFEAGIITFFGIALAVILAYTLCPFMNAMFDTKLSINLFSNSTLLLFVFGMGIATTLFTGYYPGLVLAGFNPVTALKGKVSLQSAGGFNTRRTLIVTQFAISQVLIIGMIVIMNQLRYARQSDLGFAKEAIVLFQRGEDADLTVAHTMKNEIARIPGVEKVSLCYGAPASEYNWNNSIKFENDPEEVDFRTSIKAADEDYLDIFDLELIAGKNLSPSDTVREMIVNEAMIRKLGLKSAEDALGKIITANGGDMVAPIIGVIKDFHDKSFHNEITPVLLTTFGEDFITYAVKLNLADAPTTIAAIEKMWTSQFPNELFKFQFLDETVARFYHTEQTMLKLIQIFSFVAIFIGCLGLYGLVSFMAAHRTKEVGIRKVLGGSIEDILWMFWKEFLRLIVIAFFIAAPMGWWLMNLWLQDFKFQVEIGAWIFIVAIGSSIVIAAVTISYQVIKTALLNPVQSLRTE